MFLLFFLNHLLACEFEFVYNQGTEELQYNIPQSDFTALGIWTRYYTYYSDVSIRKNEKEKYRFFDREFIAQQIMVGYYEDGTYLQYFLIIDNPFLKHFLIINNQQDNYFEYSQANGEEYEGTWMFTYIGIIDGTLINFLVNTKTNYVQQDNFDGQVKQLNSIKLFGESQNIYPFSGQISFTFSQKSLVKFIYPEDLLTHLKSCSIGNTCDQNQINVVLSGVFDTSKDKFDSSTYVIQDNFWIDGWFIFTPITKYQIYNSMILQLVQQGIDLTNQGNDIPTQQDSCSIPLKISINIDYNKLANNGIIVQTSDFMCAWDDLSFPKSFEIFNESYLKLLQNWVYFRFIYYDSVDHNAEFYLSFSQQNYVYKNMGKLNLFKYGKFSIYLVQQEGNPNKFRGQLANIHIQSCLESYPNAMRCIFFLFKNNKKKACKPPCLTCMNPFPDKCLTCDFDKGKRILNPYTNSCECQVGLIEVKDQGECVELKNVMKQSTFLQVQIQQSEVQPCKEGQFQYNIQDQIKCYDCPQQKSNGIFCAECLENPYTWQNNMTCYFVYKQYNDDEDNVFIKYSRPRNPWYYFQEVRYRAAHYETYFIQDNLLCQVCGDGIKVKWDGLCRHNRGNGDFSCIHCQQNCVICSTPPNCQLCIDGFTQYGRDCVSCPNFCLACHYSDEIKQIICDQCQVGVLKVNGICYQCGSNCLACEFDQNFNRLQCLTCKSSGYFIPFDGFDCIQNTISNCLIQYQQELQFMENTGFDLYNIKTTLGFEKIISSTIPIIRKIITNNCALCEPNYMNGDTNCVYNTTLKSDDQVLIKPNFGQCCIRFQQYEQDGILYYDFEKCKDEYFSEKGIECERKILSTQLIYLLSSHQDSIIITDCLIDNCIQCLNVQDKLRCILCSQGCYLDILKGFCLQCPQSSNSNGCQQQNRNNKDGWKWNIRAYSNYKFESNLVTSLKDEDYEIIWISCNQGFMLFDNKCIQDCPNYCSKCSIIDGQNVCTFCKSINQGRILTTQNNQCQKCPSNCEFCQPRLQAEVYAINGLFNPDNPSMYFYSYICLKPKMDDGIFYNQFFQQYVKCKDGKFCMSQLNIKLKAHCHPIDFNKEKLKYSNEQDFYFQNILFYDGDIFGKIETEYFIQYLNDNHIESMTYEVSIMRSSVQGECFIANTKTRIPSNVFSIIQMKLIINANNLYIYANDYDMGNIEGFTHVEFQQARTFYAFYPKISHKNQVNVRFKDMNFRKKKSVRIYIINPIKIELYNCSIKDDINSAASVTQKYFLSYDFTNSSNAKYLKIHIENSQIEILPFTFDFLILKAGPQVLGVTLQIKDSLIYAQFKNSSFINQQQIISQGQIDLINVTFIIQAFDTSIIQLNGFFNVQISELKLSGNFTRSYFIRTQKFNINNSAIFETTLYASTLFTNNILSFNVLGISHQIDNLTFNALLFDEKSNFISILNQLGNDQLSIQKVQVLNCELIIKVLINSQFSLIIFEGEQFILKDSLFNKSIFGQGDISIKQSKYVIIDNVTVQGNNIQGLQNKSDCFQKLVQISIQNFFIQLQDIQYIELKNSHFINLMIQNYPIIGIFCFDANLTYQINIRNTSFKNNLILITEQTKQASIFQLTSTKPGNFSAIQISFTENILNAYLQNKFQNSATTFLVEAPQFKVVFNDTLFQKNQIFNSSDGILYIQAKTISVSNSIFTNSNKYDDFILQFILWGYSSLQNDFYQENFQEIFPIASKGNAKFVVDELMMSFCQFSNSITQQGSGLHITLQSFLQISDTTFTDLRNKMDNDDSQGGSIFISLIDLNTQIEIKNSNFYNSSSLYGGAIYINSQYTTLDITLSQIIVENCFSFKGTFILLYLNKYSKINITNIQVKNTVQGFKEFLTQFKDLKSGLFKQYHLNSAIFYIQYGSLFMSNSTIRDIQFSSVIYFYSATNLYIQGMVILNIQFSSLGLIQIFASSDNNKTAHIQNIYIQNCINVQPQKILCSTEIKSFINNFECYNYQYKPTTLTEYPYDQEAKYKCFQNKLLDFTISQNMLYMEMIQTSDYLYISDLKIINCNCSLCKDGMIRIKNVDVNTPELNNIFKECSLGLIQIFASSDNNKTAHIQNIYIQNCINVQPQKILCSTEIKSFINNFECYNYQYKPTTLTEYPYDQEAKYKCFQNKLLDFTISQNMLYMEMIQTSDYLYISDLKIINCNCSLCKDGMIRIKNVDVNTPELNNIVFKQLQFYNNSCGSGCLVISQQDDITFPARRLLQTLHQGIFNIPFTVLLEQSSFMANNALNGIIIVSNLSLAVSDSKFIRNIGFNISGGILFLGNTNQNFQIITSEISENIGIKGGALYLNNKTISDAEQIQVLLSSNEATYFGQDLADIPQELTILINKGKILLNKKTQTKGLNTIQEIVIEPYQILGNYSLQQFLTLPSGQKISNYEYYDEKSKVFIPYNLSLRLIGVNNLQQQIKNLKNSYCTIQRRKLNINTQDYVQFEDFISNLNFDTTTEDYNLDQLIINFDPYLSQDYVQQLRFNCTSVYIPIINSSSPYNVIGYSNNYELRLNIRTFKCQRGESYNAQLGTCNLCDASQQLYSVVIRATKCSVQDDITMKSVKSTLIQLRENYWRPYYDNNIVAYCYNFPVNCNGGWSTGDESCAYGHIGALCEQCDLYNIRGNGSFAQSGQFQCSSCSDLSLNIQIFIVITWTLISILISVKGNVEIIDEIIIRNKAIKVGFVSQYFEKVQIAILMKILTNYLQIMSSIGTFQLNLPLELKSVFTFSGNPIKSAMQSLDCFLVKLSSIQILYFRNIWFLFMPIYYSTILFLIYFILVKINYVKFKITVLSTTLIFIFIYVQPDIVGSFTSLLSYRNISQIFWIQGNVSYLYLTPVHARWLISFVVPILILFGLLIPTILLSKMSEYKSKLDDFYVLRVYGYLYNEYRKETYYWEIIKICQKELIIIFLTFYEDAVIIKGAIMFLIIFCYDMVSKKYRPYKKKDLNKLDSKCSHVCQFSIILSMAIYSAEQNGETEIIWPLYIFIGIFNSYFIIRLIILLIKGYLDKLSDQIDQIRDYINNKYPNIIVKYPRLKKYLENSKIRSQRIKQRFQKVRKYLWKKIDDNKKNQLKNKDVNQNNEKNESKYDAKNIDVSIESSVQQPFQEYPQQQSICSPSNMSISIDEKILEKRLIQFDQSDQDNQDIKSKKNKVSYESIPNEIQNNQESDFTIQEQDLQNNQENDEQ